MKRFLLSSLLLWTTPALAGELTPCFDCYTAECPTTDKSVPPCPGVKAGKKSGKKANPAGAARGTDPAAAAGKPDSPAGTAKGADSAAAAGKPDSPAGAVKPADPTAAGKPDSPAGAVKPADPTATGKPDSPAGAAKPADPTTTGKPDSPAGAAKGADSAGTAQVVEQPRQPPPMDAAPPRSLRGAAIGVGVGGLLLVGAGATLLAIDKYDGTDCWQPGNVATCKSIYRTITPGAALIAGGGAALIGATVLFVIDARRRKGAEARLVSCLPLSGLRAAR